MSNRATRRQALAAIALADAPAPKEITFRNDRLSFEAETIADLRIWAEFFGASDQHVEWAFANPARFNSQTDGRPMHNITLYPDWRGWRLYLSATEYVDGADVEPLDDDTRAALAEVAAGGETA